MDKPFQVPASCVYVASCSRCSFYLGREIGALIDFQQIVNGLERNSKVAKQHVAVDTPNANWINPSLFPATETSSKYFHLKRPAMLSEHAK